MTSEDLYLKAVQFLRHHWKAVARTGPNRPIAVEPLREPVRILSLICPLRYDILIRARFFAFYAETRALYASDRDAFLEAPEARDYYTWFAECHIRRSRPELYPFRKSMREHFLKQVERATALYDSMAACGFACSHGTPLTLQSGMVVRCKEGLKLSSARFFPGDGCHRLAWLHARGREELNPGEAVVRRFQMLRPIDATRVLLRKLPLTEAQYVRFLAAGYLPGKTLSTLADLAAALEDGPADKRKEVRAVIRLHGMRIPDASVTGPSNPTATKRTPD